MLEDRPVTGRLDSWKEIAAYLHRDVRTVIRWEREKALPIHRVPGGRRQAVFAYKHEIDAWLVSQPANGNHANHATTAEDKHSAQPGPNLLPSTPASQPEVALASKPESLSKPRPFQLKTWKMSVAALCLLVLIWSTGAMLVRSHGPAAIRSLGIHQLTDDGHSKGYPRTDGTFLYFNQAEGGRSVLAYAPMSGSPVRQIETPFDNVSLQDISLDGNTLLVISYKVISLEGPLWTIPARGGTPRRIGDRQCFVARWSPDNRKIACAGKTAITVMDSDGSNPHTIASFSMPLSQIAWNPDGNHIRYVLNDTMVHTSSQWEIEIATAGAATPAQQLFLGPGCCLDWTWTRDGRAFAYIGLDTTGKSHLMMQSSRSTPSTEIPASVGTVGSIAPGKSDDTLYLAISGTFRGELLKFKTQHGTFETMLPGLSASYLCYSRDGRWMTYTDSGGGAFWRSRADGSQPFQLASASMDVQVSSWSPDGRRIAFMGRKPGQPYRIYLTHRNGGPIEEASEGDDNQGGPSWSPDGKFIVYGNVFCEKTQDCWIRRIDLATHKVETLPGSNGLRTARWSPDGRYIAALRFQDRELMLFDLARQRWKVLADSVGGDNINWSSDSQYVYVDSPRDKKPTIERVRVRDGRRSTVVSLALLENVPGTLDTWFGLTPDNAPILSHIYTPSEIYELQWTDK